MTRDVSPILDRHAQEKIGRALRERLQSANEAGLSSELDALLASLRMAEDRRDSGGSARN